jgi:Ca-activated chloride channel family protein
MLENKKIYLGIRYFLVLIMFMIISAEAYSQPEKKYIRKGNRDYDKQKYAESEILYRKADEKNPQSPDATFNIGDALYKQKKYEDAGKKFADNTTQTTDSDKKAAGWYNLGNSLLQANKLKESIEAYKNALKLDPENLEAKYNLGYAQNLLRKQEQQQQQQQQQNKNNQQDKDQQNKQDKNNKDQKNNQDQQDQQQQQQDKQQQQQQGISKEDAERLLNALANDEKNVQEKVKREKAAKTRSRTLKNW